MSVWCIRVLTLKPLRLSVVEGVDGQGRGARSAPGLTILVFYVCSQFMNFRASVLSLPVHFPCMSASVCFHNALRLGTDFMKAVMMRASDGYWFQVPDETGRQRVSFLGFLPATTPEVARWCEAHDVQFLSNKPVTTKRADTGSGG